MNRLLYAGIVSVAALLIEYQPPPLAFSPLTAVPYLEEARAMCASRLGVPSHAVVEMTTRQGRLETLRRDLYTYKFVHALSANTCAVDLDVNGNEVDAAQLIAREVEARFEVYGSLKPEQHAYVMSLSPDELVPVTIWAKRPKGTPDFRRNPRPYAAKKAFTASFMRALSEALRQHFPDSAPTAIEAAFAVRATLTPKQVLSVARWATVDEVMAGDAADLLTPEWHGTHNLAGAQARTDGALGRVGFIEFGIWNPLAVVPTPIILRDGSSVDSFATSHAQTVAGMFSNATLLAGPGTIPAGTIYYAAAEKSAGAALSTASSAVGLLLEDPSRAVDVINMSFYIGTANPAGGPPLPTPNPEAFGRYCDEQAFDLGATFVAGAGNDAAKGGVWAHVYSPANGLNVIGVGMFKDNRTTGWEDDAVSPDSAWRNPPGVWGDRSKPDVVASGDPIRVVSAASGSLTEYRSATSFAGPIVSGTIGLMNDIFRRPGRTSSLPVEVVRSVLLATAINNVDREFTTRPGWFPWTHLSDADGAGGMDSGEAVKVMEASQVSMEAYGVCAAPQSRRELQFARFNLRYGQRARAAIAWSSLSTPLSTPTADLEVMVVRIDPVSGAVVGVAAWSGSMESNAEMVEFTAEQAGTYQLYLLTRSCTKAPMYVGYAWWVGP